MLMVPVSPELNVPGCTFRHLFLTMAREVRFGPIALLASGPQRGGERDHRRLRTGTYHPGSPQVPLQANGLVPVWLKKHVQARDRLVCILPQKGQGNLAL
jgi:hypothetical protein